MSNDIDAIRRAYQRCTPILDLCDEIETLRATNAALANDLAEARRERDAAVEKLAPSLALNVPDQRAPKGDAR